MEKNNYKRAMVRINERREELATVLLKATWAKIEDAYRYAGILEGLQFFEDMLHSKEEQQQLGGDDASDGNGSYY
jgi:hypothetical protein